MRRALLPLSILTLSLALSACGTSRPPVVSAPQPAPQPAPVMAAGPSVLIEAPSSRVRSTIAARTAARGGRVASNTPDGIVLEGPLPETNAALADQCGPHQPGRTRRIVLGTQTTPQGTVVTESRYIIDGPNVCQVRLTAEEAQQANASLEDLRKQVLAGGAGPRRVAGAPGNVAPPSISATPQR
ncbi:MAG: hypothetical protein ACRCYS_16035 [Beijerinckiaceae bacterium]